MLEEHCSKTVWGRKAFYAFRIKVKKMQQPYRLNAKHSCECALPVLSVNRGRLWERNVPGARRINKPDYIIELSTHLYLSWVEVLNKYRTIKQKERKKKKDGEKQRWMEKASKHQTVVIGAPLPRQQVMSWIQTLANCAAPWAQQVLPV